MKILTRGEDVNTLAVVGKVSPVVTQSGSTDGDGLLSSCGGIRAGILVVIASSDGEVHPRFDGPVDGIVQSLGHTTTQRHVGDRTLVLRPPGGSVLSLGRGELVSSLLGSPQNASDNITHGATSVGSQDLDSNEVDSLGNAVLARTNRAGAMGSVTIAIIVDVILRNGLAPGGPTLELGVVDVDPGIDDVHVNTLTAGRVVVVESESSETEFATVGDTGKTLGDRDIINHATRAGLRNVPVEQSTEYQGRGQWSLVRHKQPLASL